MLKSDAMQEVSEAFAAAGVSAEQAADAAQELADAAKKALPEIKPPKQKREKPRRIVERCACAICHSSRVTLLKREGAYVCGPCYRKLLTLRALEKQQQKERAEI